MKVHTFFFSSETFPYGNGGYNSRSQETDGKPDVRPRRWCYKCDREGHTARICYATTTSSGGVIPNPGVQGQVKQLEDPEIVLELSSGEEED